MKDKILKAALKQLRLGGYDALNFGTIASELGITRANVHHHFKNKQGLALEAVKIYVDEEKQAFDKLLSSQPADLRGVLSALEDHLVALVAKNKTFTACVGSQLVRDSIAPVELRNIALERFREEARDVERLVCSHFEQTPEAQEKAQKLAFRVVAAMHGIDMMAQIDPDARTLASRIKGTLTTLIE